MRRLLAASIAALAVAASSQGRCAEADPANPFAVGDFDIRNTCAGAPFLHLAIANRGSVPSSKDVAWRDATLYVAYLKPNGTFYPIVSVALANIAPGSEQRLEIPVSAADPTYTIAIKATSVVTHQIVPLLRGTAIAPSRAYCEAGVSAAPASVAKAPDWAKPCPGNTKCSYVALNAARSNTVDRTKLVAGAVLRFDLSSIPKGRSIWYAALVLKPKRTMLDDKFSNGTTCRTRIAALKNPRLNSVLDGLDDAPYASAIDLDRGSSPQISLDITPIVRAWASRPTTNHGLVLRGKPPEENLSGSPQNACVTQYRSIQLRVQYAV